MLDYKIILHKMGMFTQKGLLLFKVGNDCETLTVLLSSIKQNNTASQNKRTKVSKLQLK